MKSGRIYKVIVPATKTSILYKKVALLHELDNVFIKDNNSYFVKSSTSWVSSSLVPFPSQYLCLCYSLRAPPFIPVYQCKSGCTMFQSQISCPHEVLLASGPLPFPSSRFRAFPDAVESETPVLNASVMIFCKKNAKMLKISRNLLAFGKFYFNIGLCAKTSISQGTKVMESDIVSRIFKRMMQRF